MVTGNIEISLNDATWQKKMQHKGCRRKRERNFDVGPKKVRKVHKTSQEEPSHDVSLLMNNLQCENPFQNESSLDFVLSGEKVCGKAPQNSVPDIERSIDGAEDHVAEDVDIVIEHLFGSDIDGICDRSSDPIQHLVQNTLDCDGLPILPPPLDVALHCDDHTYELNTYEDVAEEPHHQLFPRSPDGGSWDEVKQLRGVPGGRCSNDQNHQKYQARDSFDVGSFSHREVAVRTHHQISSCPGVVGSWDRAKPSNGVSDDICGYENLCSSDPSQQEGLPRRLSASERVFCDMGVQIEVTPITSRRWRLF